jgi:hypothetical protein
LEDLIAQIQEGHKLTIKNLQESTVKYKAEVNKKRHPLEFEEGDFVWAVLTKDRFLVGEYNKLAARKIGPIEIVKKINPNAYQLKVPSHINTSDVFNVKHLVPFIEDSSEEDANSRANSVQPREDDVEQDAWEYMRKKRRDVKVKPPQRMTTRSQTRATAEDQKSQLSGIVLDCRSIERIRSIVSVKATNEDNRSHLCLHSSLHGAFKLIFCVFSY